MLEVLRGMERGASLANSQAAVEAAKFTGGDDKPLTADASARHSSGSTERLMTADAIEVDGDMVTVKSGPGGDDMIFGTAPGRGRVRLPSAPLTITYRTRSGAGQLSAL